MRFRFLSIAVLGLAATLFTFIPAATQAQSASQRCFPETGYCISGPIRSYWERNGGLAVFGYPISAQQTETVEGRTIPVQWFERDRLEIQRDGTITAGRLGARFLEVNGRTWTYGPNRAPQNDCVTFHATGHSLCGAFRGYWERNGGLERFGYPITPVIEEILEGRTYSVQYFERRRMEYHPENVGTPFAVLLGLLGKEIHSGNPGNADVDIERDQARISLYEFFDALASGNYARASQLYGGDMRQLAEWNPDIRGDIYGDERVRAALLQRGCTQNGLICTQVKGTSFDTKIGTRAYGFETELLWVHGGPFRHPVTGQTRFTYDVVFTSDVNGEGYKVMQLPPYVN
jgi:hypothetical protein